MLRLALLVDSNDDLDCPVLTIDIHDFAVAKGLVEDRVARLQRVELLLRDSRGLAPLGSRHLGVALKSPGRAATGRLAAAEAELETGTLVVEHPLLKK